MGTNNPPPKKHVQLLIPVIQSLKPSRLAFKAIGRYDYIGAGLPLTCAPAPLFLPSQENIKPTARGGALRW